MIMLDLFWLFLVVNTVYSFFMFPKRRERIETTCIKEPEWKTFVDEWITNGLLFLLVYFIIFVTYTLLSIF